MVIKWRKDPHFIEKVREADAVLNSPIFQEVYAALEAQLIAEWKVCQFPEARERYHVGVVMLERIKQQFQSYSKTLQVESLQSKKKGF